MGLALLWKAWNVDDELLHYSYTYNLNVKDNLHCPCYILNYQARSIEPTEKTKSSLINQELLASKQTDSSPFKSNDSF